MFKKNDTVYIAGSWNGFHIGSVQRARVHSWGKKRAYVFNQDIDGNNEKLARTSFYLIDGVAAGDEIFGSYQEAHDNALETANACISEEKIRNLRNNLVWYNPSDWRYARAAYDLQDYEKNGVYVRPKCQLSEKEHDAVAQLAEKSGHPIDDSWS